MANLANPPLLCVSVPHARAICQLCRAFIYILSATLSHVDVLYLYTGYVHDTGPRRRGPSAPRGRLQARLVRLPWSKSAESGVRR